MKTIKLMAAFTLLAAVALCSCGKKEDTSIDEVSDNIGLTESETESELIEINPFDGWDLADSFTREEDGKIHYNRLPEGFASKSNEMYMTLAEHEVHGVYIELFTKDGKKVDYRNVPENETFIAKCLISMIWIDKDADVNDSATEEETFEYAKEHGILLTEMSREVVAKVADENEE